VSGLRKVDLIRNLDPTERTEKKLWRDKDGNYYISSVARLPDILYGTNEFETAVFECDADGFILNYTPRSRVKFAGHEWALRAAELEWDIIDVESTAISGELGKGE